MLKSRLESATSEELNSLTMQLAHENNIRGLYDQLFKRQCSIGNKVPVAYLAKETIQVLLDCLVQSLDIMESLLILGNVIDLHYRMLFLDPSMAEGGLKLVCLLYTKANALVESYAKSGKSKSLLKTVNAILCCLKALIMNL
jgi:hypothetical protein